jgi:D-3-phosphoglycerate dehydrogenase / 2-oxoglutarate reductase
MSAETAAEKAQIEVLVTDPIAEEGLKLLETRPGFVVRRLVKPSPERLREALATASAWLVRSETKVTEEALKQAPRLKLVGRAGVGVDNIDLEAASRRGVLVMNVPGGNTLAATEHAWAMLLALSRNVAQADAEMKAGKWERGRWMGSELAGKTLGIIGLGRIGREVGRRAVAFGMRVIGFDPFLSQDQARGLGVEPVELDELLRRSDYLTLHASLTEKTRHLIGREALSKMKPEARLVNCARGELIDEDALLAALRDKRLRGAALDVFSKEPLPADSPLRKEPRLILTPHLGASTEEAQLKVATELADNVAAYFERGRLRNAVNLPGFEPEVLDQIGGELELAERLGRFCAQLLTSGLRLVRVHLSGEFAAAHRRPLAVAALKGVLSSILDESGLTWVNAPLVAEERGIRLVESSEDSPPAGFERLLAVEVVTESETQRVAGSLLASGEPRLVRFGTLTLDVVLAGKMLVLRNSDTPGMIGRVGTLLGDAKVNIADMRVGRQSPSGDAAMVITVDDAVPGGVLDGLSKLQGIQEVHYVEV